MSCYTMSTVGGSGDEEAARKEGKVYKRKIKQRAGHRGHVTKMLAKVAEEISKDCTKEIREQLHAHKIVLVEKLDALKILDDDILDYLSDPEEIEAEIEGSGDTRHKIHASITGIESYISDNISPPGSRQSPPPQPKYNPAKLAKIKIDDFHGDPLKFQSFWDCYNAAIHSDSSIGKSLKFTYLRGLLKGTAQAAVNGLTLTDSNYDEAVTILRDRFGNKQLLISANMDRLLSIKPISDVNDVGQISGMFNDIETCVRNLRSLEVDEQQYGQALISIIWRTLPSEMQLVMSRQLPVNEEWETDVFLEVLKREVESREICSHMRGKHTGNNGSSGYSFDGNEDDDNLDVLELGR